MPTFLGDSFALVSGDVSVDFHEWRVGGSSVPYQCIVMIDGAVLKFAEPGRESINLAVVGFTGVAAVLERDLLCAAFLCHFLISCWSGCYPLFLLLVGVAEWSRSVVVQSLSLVPCSGNIAACMRSCRAVVRVHIY